MEVQGTAEAEPFSSEQLTSMMELAREGCSQLFQEQYKIVGEFFPAPGVLMA